MGVMIPHVEHYEHIGEVSGLVHDLHVVWKVEQEQRKMFVPEEDAWVQHGFNVPVPPSLAWEYLTDPDCARQWLNAHAYKTVKGKRNGRLGAGTVQHCEHGDNETAVFVIEDWRPFDYFTVRGLFPLDSYMFTTYRLEPIDGGTRIHLISNMLESVNGFKTAVIRLMGKFMFEKHMMNSYIAGGEIIQNMVEADLASGKVVVETAVAPVYD